MVKPKQIPTDAARLPLPAVTVIARWVAGFELPANRAIVDAGTRALVDVVGCALAGASHPVTAAVAEHSSATYGPGTCLRVDGLRASPLGAALVNGVAAHVLDYDDTCFEGIVHASAVVWPAVHAAAELSGAAGGDYLAAFVAGIEAECALGRALGVGLYDRGWWNTGLLGSIGAAAGAARALGLEAEACGHAIAIAAAHGGGHRSVLGYAAKPAGCGLAARSGLEAALLARSGIDGPADAFESARGFAAIANGGAFDADALALLGQRFALLAPGFAFKAFPACSAAQAAAEAVILLRGEHRIAAQDVAAIECEVTPLVVRSLIYDRPRTPAQAQFSLSYAVAQALVYGGFGVDALSPSALEDPLIIGPMGQVRMIERADLAASEADRMERPEAAIVTIRLRDGSQLTRAVPAATGMPANPMSEAAIDAKFMGNARRRLAEADSARLLATLRSMSGASGWRAAFEAALLPPG